MRFGTHTQKLSIIFIAVNILRKKYAPKPSQFNLPGDDKELPKLCRL